MELPKRPPRRFLPDELKIESWEDLKPFLEDLKNREVSSKSGLDKWLKDLSELDAVLEENQAWRYIKMSINTTDEDLRKDFEFFVTEVEPKVAPYSHEFDKKLVNSPFVKELDQQKFEIPVKKAQKRIEVFREENIPLKSKLQTEAQKFGSISAGMSVTLNGEEMTMQKAASHLKDPDRSFREEVYTKISEQRSNNKNAFNNLFDSLVKDRHRVAQNADFDNYRDYMFSAMSRFDYTPEDCFQFHDAVEKEIVPLTDELAKKRKAELGVDRLRPWDMAVDVKGRPALKPFNNVEELVEKTVQCFNRLDPYFGDCIATMDKMGHLDLDSKKGKAPGGYNYPLYEIGVPFIFMNAVGTVRDMVTMLHEGGHAVHSFLSRDLELTDFKNVTSEIAELASMSMELMTLPYWDAFFDKEEDRKRAQEEHLEDVMGTLPWIALIDKFQHWIYENPEHTAVERHEKWVELHKRFTPETVDYGGIEDARAVMWQKQLHLFEVPFYYIEYGMAQLGAIAVFKNFKSSPEQAVKDYRNALALGYTRSIGEIYGTAGVQFDFSQVYIKELTSFVQKQLEDIN